MAELAAIGSARAQSDDARRSASPASASPALTSIKQIEAGDLNVGYTEMGPADGSAVVLLHGWPYDIQSFAAVAPLLSAAGRRVIVPYLRGYGSTRFVAEGTVRNGEPAALAVDLVALLDALKIDRAILAGFDWGARTADIVAALWPERSTGLVSVSGYLIGSQRSGTAPLPPEEELQWWYQFYFATERGRAGYDKYRRDFSKLIWRLASPKWEFDDVTFDRTAAAFMNPDHVAIVIHNYRWRLGLADGEAKVRRPREPPRRGPDDCRSDDHDGGRCERSAASRCLLLRGQILGALRASRRHRRRRAQSAPGGAEGVRSGGSRRRKGLREGPRESWGSWRR